MLHSRHKAKKGGTSTAKHTANHHAKRNAKHSVKHSVKQAKRSKLIQSIWTDHNTTTTKRNTRKHAGAKGDEDDNADRALELFLDGSGLEAELHEELPVIETPMQRAVADSNSKLIIDTPTTTVFENPYLRSLSDNAVGPVQMFEIDRIPSKLDVPITYLRQFSSRATLEFLLSKPTEVDAIGHWLDYKDAYSYYQGMVTMFEMLTSPQESAMVLLENSNAYMSSRLLQDQVLILLIKKGYVKSPQSFINRDDMLSGNFLTSGFKLFLDDTKYSTVKRAQLWKYRPLADVQASDFEQESSVLYPDDNANNTFYPIPPRMTAQIKKSIDGYYGYVKNLYHKVFLAHQQLMFHKGNPTGTVRDSELDALASSAYKSNHPTIIYEDLIIALFYDMWFNYRTGFSTASFVKKNELAEYFTQSKTAILPNTTETIMSPILFKLIDDWKQL